MSTYREMVYMVLDQNKLSSDDAYITEEHVLFLLSKLRAYLIKSKYEKMKQTMSPSNIQTLCIDVEPYETDLFCITEQNIHALRSTDKVPTLLMLNNYEGLTSVRPADYGALLPFVFVNPTRFESVGYDKWQRQTIYVTIGPDGYVYIKSQNPAILNLEKIKLAGVFEDADKAAEFQCDSEGDTDCPANIMDKEFPLEEGLVTLLLDTLGQQLYQFEVKPKDDVNDANDTLNSMHQYLSTITKEKYK